MPILKQTNVLSSQLTKLEKEEGKPRKKKQGTINHSIRAEFNDTENKNKIGSVVWNTEQLLEWICLY